MKLTIGFAEELFPLFGWLDVALDDLAEDVFFSVLEEDFILASSASNAGASVLTMASRLDCLDKDWTARRTMRICDLPA